jgi:class 3 adenylate cyclase
LQRKSLNSPEEVRRFPSGRVELVHLDETVVGRFRFEPGWHWATDVSPISNTASCQNRHLGYVFSGTLHAVMDDGTELDILPGDAYEIPPGHDAWVVGDEPWDTVEFTSARHFAVPSEDDQGTLSTILFTDIVDSTLTLARVGDAAWEWLLLAHNELMRSILDRFHGREIVTTGDGFLALFDGASRAVRCAAAMVSEVEPLGLRIRAGLHTGEVAVIGGQARGLAVHAAARVAALAGPGEVLVSASMRDALDGSGMDFEDRGVHELKGLSGPRAVFALRRTG